MMNKEKERQMEYLDRGVVAVKITEGVFVSWRLLGIEDDATTFDVYRDGKQVNDEPIVGSTNYLDEEGTIDSNYQIITYVNGDQKLRTVSKQVHVWDTNYLTVPLRKPEGGVSPDGSTYTYSANDISVGDLDGDGEYEIILKWDPSNSKDNAHRGYTGEVFIDAYKLDGTFLWRISLGKNIRAGAHYTQFLVYDLDGDGKAEVDRKSV